MVNWYFAAIVTFFTLVPSFDSIAANPVEMENLAEQYGKWLGAAWVCDLPAKKLHKYDREAADRLRDVSANEDEYWRFVQIARKAKELTIFTTTADESCEELEDILDADPPWSAR